MVGWRVACQYSCSIFFITVGVAVVALVSVDLAYAYLIMYGLDTGGMAAMLGSDPESPCNCGGCCKRWLPGIDARI